MMQSVMNIGLVLVLVAGAYRIDQGKTEIGQIIAFVTYFTIILGAVITSYSIHYTKLYDIKDHNRRSV